MSRSSTVGSIYESHLTRHMPTPAYKITKAALNMLTLQWAEEYESKGFTICAISPGVSPPFPLRLRAQVSRC